MATPSEQPATQESPQQHESNIEERIMSLLEGKPATKKLVDAPAVEAPATEAAAEDSQEQPEETATEEEAPQETEEKAEEKSDALPEAVDVEYEGKSYKVPPPLKDAILRQSDYTRKTQELADARKSADAIMQNVNKLYEMQQASQKQLGQLAAVDEQIAQYEKVDWNTLTAQDATRAQQLFIQFQQAKDSKAKLTTELQAAQSEQMKAAQAARAAKVEEGQKALARDIKGWNPEHGRKLMDFASSSYGFSTEELSNVIDPRTVRLMNDAYQFRQLQSKPVAQQKVAPASKTLKPQAAEAKTATQQGYEADRRALRSAKNPSEQLKAAERLILRKLG